MKKFMAVYTGTAETRDKKWSKLNDAAKKEREQSGMAAWMKWGQEHGKHIVVGGGPLGKTKKVDERGVIDTRNNLAAYVIVEAESHEAAANMFLNHPHFSIFPGDGVEIMECLEIPRR